MPHRTAAGAGALLLLAVLHAGAQAPGRANGPRQEVRTELVAQVGAVRRLMVRPTAMSPAPAQGQGATVHRVEVEVATNVRCLLVARGTSAAPVRLTLDGAPASPLRAGEARVLRALPPGVHRIALSLEGTAADGSTLPLTLELADPVTGAVAVAAAAGRGAAMGSE